MPKKKEPNANQKEREDREREPGDTKTVGKPNPTGVFDERVSTGKLPEEPKKAVE